MIITSRNNPPTNVHTYRVYIPSPQGSVTHNDSLAQPFLTEEWSACPPREDSVSGGEK